MSTPAVTPQFDVNAARQSGYSDDEILQHLTTTRNFDIQGALKSGYSKQDIINHLSTTPAPAQSPSSSSYMDSLLSNVSSISPPDSGLGAWLSRTRASLKTTLSGGGRPEGAIEPVGGMMLGPLSVAHAVTQLPSHPIKAVNEGVQGVGQTLALPLAVVNPGTMAYAAPGILAQTGVQKTAQAIGIPQDYAELLGNIAGIGAGVKTFKALNKVSPALTAKVAARTLTDAVNPNAAEMPKYQGAMENQLQNVIDHAKMNNLPITSKAQLAEAIKSAADTKRAEFQGKVDSVANEVVPTNDIPGYEGETVGSRNAQVVGQTNGVPSMTSTPQFGNLLGRGSTATIGQIYARLSQVNSELFNSYNKASARASGAAVKSTGDLAAEAAGLRKTLYSAMGDKLGMDPGDLADMNKAGGELGYLAEKTKLAADSERFTQNKSNQAPAKVSLVNPLSKDFLPDKLANSVLNKVRGNPADNSIAQTIKNGIAPDAAAPSTLSPLLAKYMGMNSVQTGGNQVLLDALSKANALPPESPVNSMAAAAGESAVDEATRGGPGTPQPSAPDSSQSYSRPGGNSQSGIADMLKQALAQNRPSQQIKDILSGDRQKIADASSFNSPADVVGFQQAAAQKLFGKDFAQLSVTQKLAALREATNLQNMKRGLYSNAAITNKR